MSRAPRTRRHLPPLPRRASHYPDARTARVSSLTPYGAERPGLEVFGFPPTQSQSILGTMNDLPAMHRSHLIWPKSPADRSANERPVERARQLLSKPAPDDTASPSARPVDRLGLYVALADPVCPDRGREANGASSAAAPPPASTGC